MNKTSVISVVGVIVALVLSVLGLTKSTPTPQTVTVRGTSPEVASPYLIVNGVTQWFYHSNFNNATSTGSGATLKQTLCSILAPTGTSSLEFASWGNMKATSTAAFIEISTSTSPFSTSTQLSVNTVSAGVVTSQRWTPVGGSVNDSIIYSSSAAPTYVNIIATGAATALGGYTYSGGHCDVLFDQM